MLATVLQKRFSLGFLTAFLSRWYSYKDFTLKPRVVSTLSKALCQLWCQVMFPVDVRAPTPSPLWSFPTFNPVFSRPLEAFRCSVFSLFLIWCGYFSLNYVFLLYFSLHFSVCLKMPLISALKTHKYGPRTPLGQFALQILFIKRLVSFRALAPTLQSWSPTETISSANCIKTVVCFCFNQEVKSGAADERWKKMVFFKLWKNYKFVPFHPVMMYEYVL